MSSQLFASLAALRTLGLTGLCFLVCLVGAARTGRSQALSDSDLVAIQFQQKLGAQVPSVSASLMRPAGRCGSLNTW